MNTVIMISGGARSGKSTFSEILAQTCNNAFSNKRKIAYIATGEMLDEEFTRRIKKHKEQRSPLFYTHEESISIHTVCKNQFSKHNVFLIECLTTWLGNIFHKIDENEQEDFLENTLNCIIELFRGTKSKAVNIKSAMLEYLLQSERIEKMNSFKEILKTREPDDKVLIMVTNEVGLGIVPDNSVSRRFSDLHGWMNQKLSTFADYIFFMISGNPLRIK